MLSINPRRLAVYFQQDRSFGDCGAVGMKQVMPSNKRKTTEISRKGSNRLRDCLSWLVSCSAKRDVSLTNGQRIKNFQISFVTLTLPCKQMHTHKEIKSRCLNLFLQNLRKRFGVSNYVWKAELQRNGNIHFHLSFDKPIHYMIIRRYWNAAIEKLGYVSAYASARQKMSFKEYCYWERQNGNTDQKKLKGSYNYGKSTNWTNPNTTDVKSVKHMKNWASYMAKYMAKAPADKDKSGPIADSLSELTGRLWFCSVSLSRLKNVKVEYSLNLYSIIQKIAKSKHTFVVTHDWCKLLFFDSKKLPFKVREMVRYWLFSYASSTGYIFPDRFPSLV